MGSSTRQQRAQPGAGTTTRFRHRVESRGLVLLAAASLAVAVADAVRDDAAGATSWLLLTLVVAIPVLWRSATQRLVMKPGSVAVHRLTGIRRWPLDGSCGLTWVDARNARRGGDRRFAYVRLADRAGHAVKLSGSEWADPQTWAQQLIRAVERGAIRATGDATEALRSYAAGAYAEGGFDSAARARAEHFVTMEARGSSVWRLPARYRSGRLVGSPSGVGGEPWTLGAGLGVVLAGLVVTLGLTGVIVAEACASHSTTTWIAAGAFATVPVGLLWLGFHVVRWSRSWAQRGGSR